MRVLGLDIGSVRIGVAVSDPAGSVASPVTVVDSRDFVQALRAFRELAEDYEPEMIVVGLPLTLAGEEGPQAATVREVAGRIADDLQIPVEYFDERLSSAEARRSLRSAGLSDREQRGTVDKVAAAIVLQGWLDARRLAARGKR